MKFFYQFLQCSGSLLIWLLIGWLSSSLAQITVDESLGSGRSSVRGATINDRPVDLIEGGTQRGANLFHSFSDFNVREAQRVYFDNPQGIERIFSRVTGNHSSRIDGTLGVTGNADLFLLNPNGIIFGSNAQLDLRGSFLATTAESVLFENGFGFSATDPQAPPLLTINVPVGLQFGNAPGEIHNQANALLLDREGNPIFDPTGFSAQGLRVLPGATLAFVGGNISMEGGRLTTTGGETTPGGRIELGSVASPDRVSLTSTTEGWVLNYNQVRQFGDIELIGGASVNASGLGGGAIQIQGEQVALVAGAAIVSNTFGNQDGEDVLIRAASLELSDVSAIGTRTIGAGRGGNVEIVTDQLIAHDGSQINVDTNAQGRGGRLSVSADFIELAGYALDANNEVDSSGLFAISGQNSTQRGGKITVTTNQLRLLNGAQINADNLGSGNAGTITIRATDLELAGIALAENGEPILIENDVIASPSAISAFARRSSSGNGGTILVTAQRLRLSDGAAIQATTLSSGDAGRIDIQVTETVELSGLAADGQTPTSLITFSGGTPGVRFSGEGGFPEATGRGGDLSVVTGSLAVRNGAVIAVGSLNPDETEAEGAGNLNIQAQIIDLDNQGSLLARTASGNGGNINLQLSDLLLLRRNSEISTTAGTAGTGGNGGSINIAADFIIAAPSQSSDITANAFTGAGGTVTISAALVGIEPREQQTAESDITATSELGVSGNIIITSPTIDPSEGLIDLPSAPVQTELAQGCQVEGGVASAEFFNSGQGGVPATPYEPLSSSQVLDDVRLPRQGDRPSNSADSSPLNTTTSDRIVEAEGWSVNAAGQVMLIAEVPSQLTTDCSLR